MVFLLGTLAFALILWANRINDRQHLNFVLSDTITDLRDSEVTLTGWGFGYSILYRSSRRISVGF